VDSLDRNPVVGDQHEASGIDLVDMLALRIDHAADYHPQFGPDIRIAGFEQAAIGPLDPRPGLCVDE
jgi:hypothetical protein